MNTKRVLFVDELVRTYNSSLESILGGEDGPYPNIEKFNAGNIAEAILAMRTQGPFDLVIVDTHLAYAGCRGQLGVAEHFDINQEVAGFVFVRAIRNGVFEDQPTDTPVIVTSTTSTVLARNLGHRIQIDLMEEVGPDVFMVKPYDTFEFEFRICQLLGVPCDVLPELFSTEPTNDLPPEA